MKFSRFDKPAMMQLTVTWRDKTGRAIMAENVIDCSERAVSAAVAAMVRGHVMAPGDTITVQGAST